MRRETAKPGGRRSLSYFVLTVDPAWLAASFSTRGDSSHVRTLISNQFTSTSLKLGAAIGKKSDTGDTLRSSHSVALAEFPLSTFLDGIHSFIGGSKHLSYGAERR
jgi:hypothetical protein